MAKVALLIAVSEYDEPSLNPLPATIKDVEAMQQVFQKPEIGGFDDVKVLKNPQQNDMAVAIETLFNGREKDDLVLLFFSGHGIKDESGKLYFATRNTRKTDEGLLIKATTVPANFVHEVMNNSRSKHEVAILDCCFSGAFAEGLSIKNDGFIDVKNQLGGQGRAILTSSTSTQYSFAQPGADISTYTRYIVEGLETGAADRDEDGFISVDELHEYAAKKVQESTPAMKPEIYAIKEGYKIKLAKAPIDEPKLKYRREIEYWLEGGNGEISFIGRTTLDELRDTLRLTHEEASAIEAQVSEPIKVYKQKLQRYEQAFRKAIENNRSFSEKTRNDLKRLQQVLGLRDEDIALIQNSQKIKFNLKSQIKFNLAAQFIGVLSLGMIVGAVTVWFIKPLDTVTPSSGNAIKSVKVIDKRENFTEVEDIPVGKFKYGGSTSWAFLYSTLESEIKRVYPKFDIQNVLIKGSGIGIQKLIDGELDFAIASRGVLPDEESSAKRKGFTLKAIPIVASGLAVAVNPRLEIKQLTKEQLSKIFSGEIKNWKEAGALADIPIKPYVRGNNTGSTGEFKKIIEIEEFGKNINYIYTTSEGLQKVAREPGAIFHGPISDVVPQCGIKTLPLVNREGEIFYPYQQENSVPPAQCSSSKRNRVNIEAIHSSEYPLPVTFHVIVKQNAQKEEQVGQAYADLLLTKQGQEIIKRLQESGNFYIDN